jgi:hypothetical protein
MDQVVADIDSLEGSLQAGRVGDVALVDLTALVLERLRPAGVADQRPDGRAVAPERFDEPAADEAGGSCYERQSCDQLSVSVVSPRSVGGSGERPVPGVALSPRSTRSAPVVVVITSAERPPIMRLVNAGAITRSAAAIA